MLNLSDLMQDSGSLVYDMTQDFDSGYLLGGEDNEKAERNYETLDESESRG